MKINRISIILNSFDYSVMKKMAQYTNSALSRIITDSLHDWIVNNYEMLKQRYGIDLNKIAEGTESEENAFNK